MKVNDIIIILILFVFYACKKTNIDSFDVVEKIVDYDSIYSDKNDLFNTITDMEIVDSILFTKHMNDEYNFSVINVNQGKLIRRWAKTGRGPNEYIQIGAGFTISESKLVFLDAAKKEINLILISDMIHEDEFFKVLKEPYPYTVDFRPRHINIIQNKKIAVGSFKKGYFGMLDSVSNILDCSFDYPFDYTEVEGIYRGTVYQNRLKSSEI